MTSVGRRGGRKPVLCPEGPGIQCDPQLLCLRPELARPAASFVPS